MAPDRSSAISRQIRSTTCTPFGSSTYRRNRLKGNAKPGSTTSVLRNKDILMEKEKEKERINNALSGLGDEAQRIHAEMCGQLPGNLDGDHPGDAPDAIDFTLNALPDPESEQDVFVHALRDLTNKGWLGLLPSLVDGYLCWKYSTTTRRSPQNASAVLYSNPPPICDNIDISSYVQYTVQVFDIFSKADTITILHPPTSTSPALDFIGFGYLVKTPLAPTVALSLKTLEFFHRIRLRKPSYSVEAFAKVISDYYLMLHSQSITVLLAYTYEIYVRITLAVEKRIFQALGWDSPNWRVQNACRACCYKLEDEPPLKYSRLWALDGNNSLKRMAMFESRTAADTRIFSDGDYYIPRNFVDRFSNEVQKKHPPVGENTRSYGEDMDLTHDAEDDLDDDSPEGDPTDGNTDVSLEQCTRNWKSAASDEKKKTWACFDESGVFVSACRHGLILWVIDMVKSGELAKYPLATVAMVLDVLEDRTMGGYDIGCSFRQTILHSSLAEKFNQWQSSFCVNAFHGYTHCYPCQLQNHPNVTEGMGLEDLETLERIFSASNELASVTRFASTYHRQLYIHMYFQQWDLDKYANTSTFILNNIIQALEIIENDTIALSHAMATYDPPLTDDAMDGMEKEELVYFSQLGKEQPGDVYAIAYVELLQELRSLENQRTTATSMFILTVPDEYSFSASQSSSSSKSTYAKEASATARLESQRRLVREKYDRVLIEVISLEVQMNIAPCDHWTPDSPQYQSTMKYIAERCYHRALNKLHQLVVQRLFELHKLNLAHTGYKLRTHLAKSLKTRCKTIRRAVDSYNAAATVFGRPALDWSRVSNFNFIEEFTLLQDTQNDIRDKPWTKPLVRELLKLRRRIKRAHEEVTRCNVEVRRLHTAIRDEEVLFNSVLTKLRVSDDMNYGAVQEFIQRRRAVNRRHLRRIAQIYALKGFTGHRTPGRRLGTEGDKNDDVHMGECHPEEQEEDVEMVDDLADDLGGLLQYFGGLAV